MRRPVVVALLLGALVVGVVPGEAATTSVGQIGFNAGRYRAYLSSLDGRAPRELPRPPGASGISTWPSWSPDGTRVAYGVEGCGSGTEYALQQSTYGDCVLRAGMVQVAGARSRSARTVLSLPGAYVWTVDWARTGDRIAVEVAADAGSTPSLIYVIGADGSGLRLLAQGERPVWAPDGRRLAYLNRVEQALLVLDVDSDDQPLRVSPPGIGVGREEPTTAPAWSPDGRRLAFVGWPASGGPQAWVVDSRGAGGRALAGSDELTLTPTWSPDSRHLAFASRGGLWVVRPDGSGRRRLVSQHLSTTGGTTRVASAPSWSPDGRWNAFLHGQWTPYSREHRWLRLIRPDGTGLRQVVDFGDPADPSNELFTVTAPLVWAPCGCARRVA
jgi:Tol biopolymer transport system component